MGSTYTNILLWMLCMEESGTDEEKGWDELLIDEDDDPIDVDSD